MVTLNIFQDGQIDLAIEALLGESVAVLGIKGSGKSNSAAVLAEELLGAGLPLCIVDIAGEYWGLKERYQVLVAGRSAHVDIELDPTGGAALAEFSLRHSVPVILDLSGLRTPSASRSWPDSSSRCGTWPASCAAPTRSCWRKPTTSSPRPARRR
jgi:DNA helicase HerA-like ATPase